MCFINDRQMSKLFQNFSKSFIIIFLVVEMFHQGRAGKEEFFENQSSFLGWCIKNNPKRFKIKHV